MNDEVSKWVEMTFFNVLISKPTGKRILLLKAKEEEKYLSMFVGVWESEAIVVKKTPRPLPYDIIKSLITFIVSLGAVFRGVFIYGLVNDIFYSKLVLFHKGQKIEFDCRPSDGVAIAERMEAKIFVLKELVDEVGITPDAGSDIIGKAEKNFGDCDTGPRTSRSITREELERMSAFVDFIENLDIDDIGKT